MFLVPIILQGQIRLGELDNISYDDPQKYEIGGITVTGIKYLDNNVLIMLSGLSVGDIVEVPGEEISKAIKNLWDQGLFDNVIISATNIQDNLIFLNIDLSERPRMSTFPLVALKVRSR
ncbi:MAG: POTRA domain-containing protein [Bacteroidales bacterium]